MPPIRVDLRPIAPEEFGAVCDLWHQGWRDGHLHLVPDDLLRFRDRATFLARLTRAPEDCRVTGPTGAPEGFVRFKGDELDQFYVAPAMRGTGYAAALIAAAEAELRGRGVRRAFLICSVGNDRAARFYAKAGWRPVARYTAEVETLAEPVSLPVERFEKDL